MLMSMFATMRYAWWRTSTTVQFFGDPGNKWGPLDAVFIVMLVGAEMWGIAWDTPSLKGANMLLKSTTCARVALPVRWSV